MQGPGRLAAQQISVERGVGEAAVQAAAEAGPDVARALQLVPHPGRLERRRVGLELGGRRRRRGASNIASAASMPDFIAV